MRKVFVLTGSSGFIGRHLMRYLLEYTPYQLILLNRNNDSDILSYTLYKDRITCMTYEECWEEPKQLNGTDGIIHLAGKAHHTFSEVEYNATNVQLTERLAELAINQAIPHFIFFSSIGVHGRYTPSGVIFTEDSPYNSYNSYSKSKKEAEIRLKSMFTYSQLIITIIRPPLVYGPSAPANFALLRKLSQLKLPLPLGGIENKRSILGIRNLCDFINLCLELSTQSEGTYIIRDAEMPSTTDLILMMQQISHSTAPLFRVSPALAQLGANLIRKPHLFEQVFLSLETRIDKAQQKLGWHPKYSTQQEIEYALSNHAYRKV